MRYDAFHVVWSGRYQPPHVGHEAILRRSLAVWSEPHICAIVWSLSDPWNSPAVRLNPKHIPEVNPFTVWERMCLMDLLIQGVDTGQERVRVIGIPRSDISGSRANDFLPPRYLQCTTNKDDEDRQNLVRWHREGKETRILDVSDLHLPSATELKTTVQAGGDWRPFIPEACHEYFASIDGPTRLLAANVPRTFSR